MSALIPILIQLVSGGAGGNIVGALLKKLPVSKILATILGAVGGVGGAQLSGVLDLLPMVLGEGGGGLGGQAGAAAGGGALLTLVGGLIKKAMAGGASSAE